MDGYQWTELIFSCIVAVSTVFYVILTRSLVNETKKTREMYYLPNIGMHIERNETGSTNLYLIIENIGFGVANNINFKILDEFDFYHVNAFSLSKKGIFTTQFEHFYPSQKFRIFIDYVDEKNIEVVKTGKMTIQTTYNDVLGNTYNKIHNLSAAELIGAIRHDPPDTYIGKISYSLNNIDQHLKTFTQNKK